MICSCTGTERNRFKHDYAFTRTTSRLSLGRAVGIIFVAVVHIWQLHVTRLQLSSTLHLCWFYGHHLFSFTLTLLFDQNRHKSLVGNAG